MCARVRVRFMCGCMCAYVCVCMCLAIAVRIHVLRRARVLIVNHPMTILKFSAPKVLCTVADHSHHDAVAAATSKDPITCRSSGDSRGA